MVYFATYFSSCFFAYIASRSKNKNVIFWCSFISILIPVTIAGVRHETVGIDTMFYGAPTHRIAASSSDIVSFLEKTSRSELLWRIVTYISAKLADSLHFTFAVWSVIMVAPVYIGAYKHRKIAPLPLTMFLYFVFYYQQTYNAMRQLMASAIMFMELDKLEQKKYFQFSLYIILASLFHRSALVAFPLFIVMHFLFTSKFLNKHNELKIIIIMAGVAIIILARNVIAFFILNIPYIAERFATSASQMQTNSIDPFSMKGMLVLYMGEFVAYAFYKKGANKLFAKTGDFMNKNFYLFNVVFIVLYSTFVGFASGRILLYSNMANILLFASLPRFTKNKHMRILITLFLMSISSWIYVHSQSISDYRFM